MEPSEPSGAERSRAERGTPSLNGLSAELNLEPCYFCRAKGPHGWRGGMHGSLLEGALLDQGLISNGRTRKKRKAILSSVSANVRGFS